MAAVTEWLTPEPGGGMTDRGRGGVLIDREEKSRQTHPFHRYVYFFYLSNRKRLVQSNTFFFFRLYTDSQTPPQLLNHTHIYVVVRVSSRQ